MLTVDGESITSFGVGLGGNLAPNLDIIRSGAFQQTRFGRCIDKHSVTTNHNSSRFRVE